MRAIKVICKERQCISLCKHQTGLHSVMLVHNKTSSLGLIQDNIQLNFAEFIFDILGRTLMCLFVYTHGFAVTATSADVRGCVSGDSPVTYPHLVWID